MEVIEEMEVTEKGVEVGETEMEREVEEETGAITIDHLEIVDVVSSGSRPFLLLHHLF